MDERRALDGCSKIPAERIKRSEDLGVIKAVAACNESVPITPEGTNARKFEEATLIVFDMYKSPW